MKLYEVTKNIKQYAIFVVLVFLLLYIVFEFVPDFISQNITPPPTAEQAQTIIKINPLVFGPPQNLQIGAGKIDFSNAVITYLGNPEQEYDNLTTKFFNVYELVTRKTTPLDYSQTAREVAFFLGYDTQDQISTGELTDEIAWSKYNMSFSINKKTQDMFQGVPGGNIQQYKNFYTAGEFANSNYVVEKVKDMLRASRRFGQGDLETNLYISDYYLFQGDFLVPTASGSSEIAYTKVYQTLDGLKVVGKNYEIPQTFFFVGSLRSQLQETYKNLQYPTFKISKNNYTNELEGTQFEVKPLTEAISEVSNFKNFVVANLKIDNTPFGSPTPQNLQMRSMTLDTFELAYYDDFEGKVVNNLSIQPIYVLRGSFETIDGLRGRITIYTRAIQSKYYNL